MANCLPANSKWIASFVLHREPFINILTNEWIPNKLWRANPLPFSPLYFLSPWHISFKKNKQTPLYIVLIKEMYCEIFLSNNFVPFFPSSSEREENVYVTYKTLTDINVFINNLFFYLPYQARLFSGKRW